MTGTVNNEFPARVGRNYKVVLAIILPCLLIIPFVYLLQNIRFKEEWQLWVSIVVFLAMIMTFSLWLVLRSYPRAVISIQADAVEIQFKQQLFWHRKNISLHYTDIISFTARQFGGDEYFVMKTKNPNRKLQISPSSNKVNDLLAFEQGMLQLAAKLKIESL